MLTLQITRIFFYSKPASVILYLVSMEMIVMKKYYEALGFCFTGEIHYSHYDIPHDNTVTVKLILSRIIK